MTTKSHDRPIQEVLLHAFRVQIAPLHPALKPMVGGLHCLSAGYAMHRVTLILQHLCRFEELQHVTINTISSQLLKVRQLWVLCFTVLSQPTLLPHRQGQIKGIYSTFHLNHLRDTIMIIFMII